MSCVNDLIRELCPDGVPFRAVGDVSERSTNVRWASVSDQQYDYIDLTSVDRITHRIGDTATVTSGDAPSRAQQIVRTGDVIFATTRPTQMRWAVIPPKYDGQIASTGYCVLRPDTTQVLASFLAHVLGSERFQRYVEANQVAGNYPSIPDRKVRAYRMPVPPIDVQREIVRVLDLFQDLDAELEAELEARRKQYAFYRDHLLSFREVVGVRWIRMGEFGTFIRGRRFTKNDIVPVGIPSIHYGEIYTHYGVSARATLSQVRANLAQSLRYARPGDVVIAGVGETVEDVGKAVAWLGDTEAAIHDDSFAFRSEQDPTYIAYVMQTAAFQVQKEKHVARAKVKRVGGENLGRIVVPVPPLDEQRRIVSILNAFDALVNDPSSGLPAELDARRQQYEYYRDRLLTFEETT